MIAVSDLFAGLALILSVVSLLWQWLDKRPRLEVSVSWREQDVPSSLPPDSPIKTIPVLSIYLSNHGRVPVYVKGLWLRLAGDKEVQLFQYHHFYSQWFEPFSVDPLRGYEFTANTKDLVIDLGALGYSENVVGYVEVRDELGKHYKSKRVRFAVSDLRPPETDATQPAP